MPPLYRERKRLREQAEREAAGTAVFTTEFSPPVRNKIHYEFADAASEVGEDAWEAVRDILVRDEGLLKLTGKIDASDDVPAYMSSCDDEVVASVIEAMDLACQDSYEYGIMVDVASFREAVVHILGAHLVAYDFIDGEMIPFESREMHQEIVAPTLRLLAGRPDLEAVEDAYRDALGEITKNPGDAITDAGRALQTTLELLGCEGNKLGPLIASAKQKGLLAAHDSGLSEGIRKIMDWVSADRSKLGDAHTHAGPSPDDAWLAVHVVGALILRLAGGPRVL